MLLCLACLQVAALFGLVTCAHTAVSDCSGTATAPAAVLSFRISYWTCHTRGGYSATGHATAHTATAFPRCTFSVRILRQSPRPAWHAVHNESVTAAASSHFAYHISRAQVRCNHQVVLRCVSIHSDMQLAVIPASGFFYAPRAQQPPVNTFVVLDSADCLLTSSSDTATPLRTYGFCFPTNSPIVHVVAPVTLQSLHNHSRPDICPVQLSPHALSSTKRSRQRRGPPRLSVSQPAPEDYPSLWTRALLWMHRQSRSGRVKRASRRQSHTILPNAEEGESTYHALHTFQSWLLVLCGASVGSAAVFVCLIVRLTRRIELY